MCEVDSKAQERVFGHEEILKSPELEVGHPIYERGSIYMCVGRNKNSREVRIVWVWFCITYDFDARAGLTCTHYACTSFYCLVIDIQRARARRQIG